MEGLVCPSLENPSRSTVHSAASLLFLIAWRRHRSRLSGLVRHPRALLLRALDGEPASGGGGGAGLLDAGDGVHGLDVREDDGEGAVVGAHAEPARREPATQHKIVKPASLAQMIA